jgi:hypothetical protein
VAISGHRPADAVGGAVAHSEAPEHDWAAASSRIFPALRPAGTRGALLDELDEARLAHEGTKKHALQIVDRGPAGIAVVYVLRETAFDVVINADHLLTWAVSAQGLREAAMANLEAWSAGAAWTDEAVGDRHVVSSDTGSGGDAARILLSSARAHIAGQCGAPARVLIGIPDRDLLIAGSLQAADESFAEQFGAFVAELHDEAHEPIERGLFEVVGDDSRLVRYQG